MARFVLFLLGFAAAISQIATGADRTLIAEGDYVAQSEKGSKPLAHWKLSQLNSGDYEVTESFVNSPVVTQTFRFDAQFLPIGYAIKIDPASPAYAHSHPNLPTTPAGFSCVYKGDELACDSEYEGKKSKGSVRAKQPYIVVLDEGWYADLTWLLTGAVRQMEHTGTRETTISVYVIKDTKPDEITLDPDKPMTLAFVGEERANVMDKMQTVRRYEERGSADHLVLLVTRDGLVASLGGKANSAAGFAMGNYKEYKPLELHGR
jgi:hypothetical protein